MADISWIEGTPRIACEVSGTGPPVVFLHGVGGNRRNWAYQTAQLSDTYTTVAWDARGYGDSDDYEGDLEFSQFGDDLARMLDHLGIDSAHLVGLSMGARVLMDFFPRNRDRVVTLTLCDCFYAYQTALTPEKQREYVEFRERPLLEGRTFADLAPALVQSLVSPRCSDSVRAELHDSILALRADSYLKTIKASVTYDASYNLADIDVPVQLIFGAEDALTPPSIGEEMLGMLSNARLAVLDGAGHLSNLERPTEFNTVLRGFLDDHADLSTT
ncbi:MAG: alpha/beta hydrolase [Acidimicrobiales bacterium]